MLATAAPSDIVPADASATAPGGHCKDQAGAMDSPKPVPAPPATPDDVDAIAKLDLQAFSVGKVLGKGKFSQVYLATARATGRQYAFKVLSKHDHRPRVMAKLRREIDILEALRDARLYLQCQGPGRGGSAGITGGKRASPTKGGGKCINSNSAAATCTSSHIETLRPHPNIVTLFRTFETPASTILLLEYIPGINLHDFVFESIRLTEPVARGMFRQLVSATSFCHARGIVHRDLKMGNVMLVLAQPPGAPVPGMLPPTDSDGSDNRTPRDWPRRLELTRSWRLKFRSSIVSDCTRDASVPLPTDPRSACAGQIPASPWMARELAESGGWLVKLVDFGLGAGYDPDGYRHTAVGSPGYFAPEIARGATYVGPEVDVWSLGVVLYEMTTGMHPFSARDLPALKEIVIRGRYAVPHHVSTALRRTYSRLLCVDPAARRALHVLDTDSWANSGYEQSPVYFDPEGALPCTPVASCEIVEPFLGFADDDEKAANSATQAAAPSGHTTPTTAARMHTYGDARAPRSPPVGVRPRSNTTRPAATAADACGPSSSRRPALPMPSSTAHAVANAIVVDAPAARARAATSAVTMEASPKDSRERRPTAETVVTTTSSLARSSERPMAEPVGEVKRGRPLESPRNHWRSREPQPAQEPAAAAPTAPAAEPEARPQGAATDAGSDGVKDGQEGGGDLQELAARLSRFNTSMPTNINAVVRRAHSRSQSRHRKAVADALGRGAEGTDGAEDGAGVVAPRSPTPPPLPTTSPAMPKAALTQSRSRSQHQLPLPGKSGRAPPTLQLDTRPVAGTPSPPREPALAAMSNAVSHVRRARPYAAIESPAVPYAVDVTPALTQVVPTAPSPGALLPPPPPITLRMRNKPTAKKEKDAPAPRWAWQRWLWGMGLNVGGSNAPTSASTSAIATTSTTASPPSSPTMPTSPISAVSVPAGCASAGVASPSLVPGKLGEGTGHYADDISLQSSDRKRRGWFTKLFAGGGGLSNKLKTRGRTS